MWEAMDFLRRLMGTKRMLACGVPLGAAFGLADYCRIGGDVHLSWRHPMLSFLRHRERVDTLSSLRSTLGRWQLNGRAFQNDPDVFILRNENQQLNPDQQETLLMINVLLGSLLFTSDEMGGYTTGQKTELEEALSWHGSKILGVTEWTNDVWKIDLKQDGLKWAALCNLTKNVQQLPLPNGTPVELRPYETLILKS
jgi:alpha-galactosidase